MSEIVWHSIRDALPVAGKRVVEVTCDDWEEVKERFPNLADRVSQVYLHFDDGSTLGIFVTQERGFTYDAVEGEP